MNPPRPPLDDDDVELEVALGMAAAAFRSRHAGRDDARRAHAHRSERESRLGRAYLDALHAYLREGAAPRGGAK